MTDEQSSYDLKQPAHLVAAQVIRDIEALQMVTYGPQHSAPIIALVEQYQELLFQRDQKIAELEYQKRQVDRVGLKEDIVIVGDHLGNVYADPKHIYVRKWDHKEGEYKNRFVVAIPDDLLNEAWFYGGRIELNQAETEVAKRLA